MFDLDHLTCVTSEEVGDRWSRTVFHLLVGPQINSTYLLPVSFMFLATTMVSLHSTAKICPIIISNKYAPSTIQTALGLDIHFSSSEIGLPSFVIFHVQMFNASLIHFFICLRYLPLSRHRLSNVAYRI